MLLVMLVAWPIGSFLGNLITQTSPPALKDTSTAAFSFLIVCIVNAVLLSVLLWLTRQYSGYAKSVLMISYVFIVQFFLTQMETYFFSASIGISNPQIVSILIAGFIMTFLTMWTGVIISNKMFRFETKRSFSFTVNNWSALIPSLTLLTVLVYPLIYLGFGYYIAWQSESLRLFYTQSTEMNSFFRQLSDALWNGIYFYQVLRGLIWIGFSVPIVLLLQKHSQIVQYFMIGLFSSLLPATLLFIPNPYMPTDVAFTHFIETATSNFLWGLIITFVVNRLLKANAVHVNEPVLNSSTTVHSQ